MESELALYFPLSNGAPRQARAALEEREALFERALFADMRLIVSELMTNAVLHSGRPEGDLIALDLNTSSTMVRIEVVDQGLGTAPLQARSTDPPSGLELVSLLSDRWSSRVGDSFHVWAEIDTSKGERYRRLNSNS